MQNGQNTPFLEYTDSKSGYYGAYLAASLLNYNN